MTADRLREAHTKTPFRPFVLHMSDGRSLRVRHPELLAIAPSGRTAVVIEADDSHHIVDVLMITDIEFKADRADGKGRKKAS